MSCSLFRQFRNRHAEPSRSVRGRKPACCYRAQGTDVRRPIGSGVKMRTNSAYWNLLASAIFLTLVASGCAVSETLDLPDAGGSGSGGSTVSGSGGTGQGSGGNVGTGGVSATGEGGITGSGGIVGTGGVGTGGSGSGGTTATGGNTGTGGFTGTGGNTGTGGFTGTGGNTAYRRIHGHRWVDRQRRVDGGGRGQADLEALGRAALRRLSLKSTTASWSSPARAAAATILGVHRALASPRRPTLTTR